MTTGKRIKAQRKRLKISAEFLAERLGVSPATVYRYESGSIEKIPVDILEPLAKILQTTPAYLMGWDENNQNILDIPGLEPLPKAKKIPLLGVIACGEPILAEQNIEQIIDAPDDIKADFALRCKGDSMVNVRIYDGSIVYIRQQPDVEDGEIAAVVIDNEATLKRVYKYPGRIVLQPENTAYPPLVYSESEINDIRIIGKAVAHTSIIK